MQAVVRLPEDSPPAPTRTWRDRLGWRNLHPASPTVVAQLGSMLTVLRWGTLSLALALAVVEHDNRRTALAGGVLVAYTLWRTIRPVGYGHSAWKVSAPTVPVGL